MYFSYVKKSSWPRGIGEIIPNPHFRLIFTSVFLGFSPPSYSFINAAVSNTRYPFKPQRRVEQKPIRYETIDFVDWCCFNWKWQDCLDLRWNSSFDKYGQKFPLLFQRYIPGWGKLVWTRFCLLSHLAAQTPVAKLWATTMVLFENIMEWVFGAFMLLMTLYGETRSNGFHQTSARKLAFLAWKPIYLAG